MMSRVDVPILKCDKCGISTSDLQEMGTFRNILSYRGTTTFEWDVCFACWTELKTMLNAHKGGA
jgi:hypothetical protein